MAYPPPSGQNATSQSPHPTLPARPPPPSNPAPPGFSNTRDGYLKKVGPATGFTPRAVASTKAPAPAWRTASPISAPPAPPTAYAAPQMTYPSVGYTAPQQYPQQPAAYPQPGIGPSPPQIRNPFPLPGQEPAGAGQKSAWGDAHDPELAQQIAQWQSAYMNKDDQSAAGKSSARPFGNANLQPLGPRGGGAVVSNVEVNANVNPDSGVASVVTGADGKQKTVVRSGGGTTWQDSSLLEWDPSHFRLFIGNLAGEVTDESLLKAFAKYPSVQRARVVRDKRTTKSKGFGFVSFSDGDDYFRAARDMNGKYIGSHPVLVKRSTTEIKAVVPKDKKNQGKGHKGGGGGNANTGAGVQKKQAKTKGGLKILG